jgi:ferredoxin
MRRCRHGLRGQGRSRALHRSGACVEEAPKAFGFDDEHIAVVLPEAEDEDDGKLLEVARACPATAILIYEDGSEVNIFD